MANNEKRYIIFNKGTYGKTGVLKPLRKVLTRAEARAHKYGEAKLGIWDTVRGEAVR